MQRFCLPFLSVGQPKFKSGDKKVYKVDVDPHGKNSFAFLILTGVMQFVNKPFFYIVLFLEVG